MGVNIINRIYVVGIAKRSDMLNKVYNTNNTN